MRRASNLTAAALSSDILGDRMSPSSLPSSFPQEKQTPGSERAFYMPPRREVSLHEFLMERPRTNTSETQAALRTLQQVLGDEETAKAIRRASVMTAGARFKQKEDSRLSLPGAYIQQGAWKAGSLCVDRAGLPAKSGVAPALQRPEDGAARFMLGSSDITTGRGRGIY